MKRLRRLALIILLFVSSAVAQTNAFQPATTLAARIGNLQKTDGFIPYYWDAKKGALLFELSPKALQSDFLYFTALGSGIGSLEMFADRSSFHGSHVCRFVRVGPHVLVMMENNNFRAMAGPAALQHSVDLSFPTSVIASLPVEAEEGGTVIVNANPLLLRDAFDLLGQFRHPSRAVGGRVIRTEGTGGAGWRIDDSRSAIDLEHTGNFPLNTETEALITFTSESPDTNANQPEQRALTVREHQSFVGLPPPGFRIRERDPRVGFFGPRFEDFSQPYNRPLQRSFIDRWRLQKKDPAAKLSVPVKPLTFYLDPAMPPDIQAAVRRGVLWWNAAFLQAGFMDALRVEDLPPGADPLDVRYSTIQWTNRAGRGWSVGQSQVDPRTGEILHAVVQLDSHRMRTVHNYWDALVPVEKLESEQALDHFAELDSLDPNTPETRLMLNRLALLACHEVGHTLGLEHNFVASTFGRGSVMDYYAPRVAVRKDGSADLSDAYMQGVGSYDKFAVEWGYSETLQPGTDAAGHTTPQERARLDAIVQHARRQGIWFGSADDPRWNPYDDGPDPVTWLRETLPVRDALLAHYTPAMLRKGEPYSDLASRFPPIYLFHQYALLSAVNIVGSAKIPPAIAGDGQIPVAVWPEDSQREALRLLMKALAPEEIDIKPELWKALAPEDTRDPERFRSSSGYLFTPFDGARAVSEMVVGGLLNPERMERLATIKHFDPSALGPDDVIAAIVSQVTSSGAGTLAHVVRSDAIERLMVLAADDNATPEVRAAAWRGVANAEQDLRGTVLGDEIERFRRDPKANLPKLKPSAAPPGPPV